MQCYANKGDEGFRVWVLEGPQFSKDYNEEIFLKWYFLRNKYVNCMNYHDMQILAGTKETHSVYWVCALY